MSGEGSSCCWCSSRSGRSHRQYLKATHVLSSVERVCIIYMASFTCFWLNYFPGRGARAACYGPRGLQVNRLGHKFGRLPCDTVYDIIELERDTDTGNGQEAKQ